MNYNLLKKILMKWAFESKEYEIVKYLYYVDKIGIPVTYLYSLQEKTNYTNIHSFIDKNVSRTSDSKEMIEILSIFKNSKYERLLEWNNIYGYRFK
jgi:hypothetical protein